MRRAERIVVDRSANQRWIAERSTTLIGQLSSMIEIRADHLLGHDITGGATGFDELHDRRNPVVAKADQTPAGLVGRRLRSRKSSPHVGGGLHTDARRIRHVMQSQRTGLPHVLRACVQQSASGDA